MVMVTERNWLGNAKTLATGLGDAASREIKVRQRAQDTDRQAIKIIGAGLARTGTSSLVVALQRLGFKSYHMIEGVIEAGHAQLWYDLAQDFEAMALRLAGGADQIGPDARVRVNASASAVIDAIAAGGFNATADFPASLYARPHELLHLQKRRVASQPLRLGLQPTLCLSHAPHSQLLPISRTHVSGRVGSAHGAQLWKRVGNVAPRDNSTNDLVHWQHGAILATGNVP